MRLRCRLGKVETWTAEGQERRKVQKGDEVWLGLFGIISIKIQ